MDWAAFFRISFDQKIEKQQPSASSNRELLLFALFHIIRYINPDLFPGKRQVYRINLRNQLM